MKKYTWRLRSDWEMSIPCACCLCFWVGLPFPKLRARTFKWMVGRRSFPLGMAQPGRCELLVSGRVSLFTKLILQETLECCQVLPAKSREWIYRIPPNTVGSPTAKIWKDPGTDRLYGNKHWTKFMYEVMKASKIPQWNTYLLVAPFVAGKVCPRYPWNTNIGTGKSPFLIGYTSSNGCFYPLSCVLC